MYKDLLEKAKKNNLEQFQIQEISVDNFNIRTFNDEVSSFNTSFTTSYVVSANYNDREVRISTEYLDDSVIDKLKMQACFLDVEVSSVRKEFESIREDESYELGETDVIKNELLGLNRLKDEYSLLTEIECQYIEEISSRKIIVEGHELFDVKYEKCFVFEVVVTDGDKVSTSYVVKQKLGNDGFDMEGIAREVIENAIDKLYYKDIVADNYRVILTGKVMGDILNAFVPMFYADTIQKDTSLLVGKKGEKVFSDKITIVEDPCNKEYLGKRLFDDAGIRTSYKEIVKNGFFNQILYDEKTASIDKVKSTGNDYGEISVRNMYIKPGDVSLSDMIKEEKRAVLVDSVEGLHGGVNLSNGDFSLQAEGYYIENGEKVYASKLFVLTGNIMELLNSVVLISDNLEFYMSTVASPDILFDSVKIVR